MVTKASRYFSVSKPFPTGPNPGEQQSWEFPQVLASTIYACTLTHMDLILGSLVANSHGSDPGQLSKG